MKKIKIDNHAPSIVILSVRKDRSIRERAIKLGADDYVTKPFLMEELLEVMDGILTHKAVN